MARPTTSTHSKWRRSRASEYDSAIAITLRSVFVSMKFEIAAILGHADGGPVAHQRIPVDLWFFRDSYLSVNRIVIFFTQPGRPRPVDVLLQLRRSTDWRRHVG
jgi:hypothetical protein